VNANVLTSDTAPVSPNAGDLWWDSSVGMMRIYYYDGTSSQWVDVNPGSIQGIQGIQGVQGTQGAQGIQGIQGAQGTQGTVGSQGTVGTQGTQGLQGIQGISGASILGTNNTWTGTNAFTSVTATLQSQFSGSANSAIFTGSDPDQGFQMISTATGGRTYAVKVAGSASGNIPGAGLYFYDQTGTGIVMAFDTTKRVNIYNGLAVTGTLSSTGNATFTAYTSARYLLIENGAGTEQGATTPIWWSPSSGVAVMSASGSERIRVSSTGLAVTGALSSTNSIGARSGGALQLWDSANTDYSYIQNNGSSAATQTIIYTSFGSGSVAHQFRTYSGAVINALNITPAGNVGIGATSPAAKLDIAGGDLSTSSARLTASVYPMLDFYQTDGNAAGRNWRIAGVYSGYGTFEILSSTATGGAPTTSRFAINSSGNVGIGTTSPAFKLSVSGSGVTSGIFVQDTNSAEPSPVIKVQGNRSDNNGSQSFSGGLDLERYNSNGSSGLVSGNVLGTIYFGGNYNTTPTFTYPASISAIAEANWTSTSAASTGLVFFTGATGQTLGTANVAFGTERMRIDSSGNITIQKGKLTINDGGSLYAKRQCLTGNIAAGSSTVSKKIVYVGPTHALDITILAIQGGSPAHSAGWSGKIVTAYGASYTGGNISGVSGNITAISVTYDNGGSPTYTLNVALTYSGAAPDIAYTIDGHSIYDLSAQ
jgi:hypothetical protein